MDYANKKVVARIFKSDEDEEELGEDYSNLVLTSKLISTEPVDDEGTSILFPKEKEESIILPGEEAEDETGKKEPDDPLMVPNARNMSILATGFCDEKNTLLVLCLLSSIVYRHDHTYEEVCASWGIAEDSVKKPDDQLIYGDFLIDDTLVITFKGSSSKKDFLTDIDLIPIDDEFGIPGKMHRGFYKLLFETGNYKHVLDPSGNYPASMPLYITGHSLGGGLASLFYGYLKVQPEFSTRNIQLFT